MEATWLPPRFNRQSQDDHMADGGVHCVHDVNNEHFRLPNGLATAAAVRFGLRPGCLIRDACDELKNIKNKETFGGLTCPDIETCLDLLAPYLEKNQ